MTFEKFKRLLKRNHEIVYNYVLTDDDGTPKMRNLRFFYTMILADHQYDHYDLCPERYNLIVFFEGLRNNHDRVTFGLL